MKFGTVILSNVTKQMVVKKIEIVTKVMVTNDVTNYVNFWENYAAKG